MNIKSWVLAFRPRTLPLALSCTVAGSCLAAADNKFRWPVLALAYTSLTPGSAWRWLFLLAFPPLLLNGKTVLTYSEPPALAPELQRLSLSTLLFALTFGFGLLL